MTSAQAPTLSPDGTPRDVAFVTAAADAYRVGYQHGAARAEALRAFLADDLARLRPLTAAPVSLESLRPVLAEFSARIASAAPAISEEIDGLAAGAGISRELAVLLQVRREIVGYQRVRPMGDCTTYGSLSAGPGGEPVLAQTVDLNGNLDDQVAVLDIAVEGTGRRALVLSFGGLLGYLGVNSDGLAIGLNLVLGGQWRPGLPPYLAIRHLLDNASDVTEALRILAGLPLASSRSLMLCDSGRLVCAELLGDQIRLLEGAGLVHANHFLHPDFTGSDELNIFARNSSVQRLNAASAGLDAMEAGAGVEEHFALLARPPVRVADTGDIRRERTVAAVVLLPGSGELHLRPGDPSASQTHSYRFAEPAA